VLVLPYGLASIYGRFGQHLRAFFEPWLGERKAHPSDSGDGFQAPSPEALQEKRP